MFFMGGGGEEEGGGVYWDVCSKVRPCASIHIIRLSLIFLEELQSLVGIDHSIVMTMMTNQLLW